MKSYKQKIGLTLVEIMIVIAVIAILIAITMGIAARIDIQIKKQLTENTIALLDAALGQFKDYGYTYNSPSPYDDLDFPLDCNNLSKIQLDVELTIALGVNVLISGGSYDPNYSGSEVMYFFLNRVPESKNTLDKIDSKLITNLGPNGNPMTITLDPGVNGKVYPLLRIVDPWGETLRYSYYDNTKEPSTNEPPMTSPRTFPVITSAGPDRKFGSSDDITSR